MRLGKLRPGDRYWQSRARNQDEQQAGAHARQDGKRQYQPHHARVGAGHVEGIDYGGAWRCRAVTLTRVLPSIG